MLLEERFISYTKFDTQSSEESCSVPSTEKQFNLARALKKELEELGLTEVVLDDKGYLYATLPSNMEDASQSVPTIGFIAHLDTAPSFTGTDVNPRIVKNYQGGDIILDGKEGIVLSPSMFPELDSHKGNSLIVTDGHTLLGADDKAGIAEIVSALEYLINNPQLKHGKIRVAFNPDEEIGQGAGNFNVPLFGCDWAYTVDGGDLGEIEYENFNAAKAQFNIKGLDVHPGYAKGKMKNALLIASDIAKSLPEAEAPASTDGYEGFYHLIGLEGTVDSAKVTIIIRDHDEARFESRKLFVRSVADWMNSRHGEGTVEVVVSDQYKNMKSEIAKYPHVVDLACSAMDQAGVKPKRVPIRGGTDGAQLSFKGLPCPNLFAGGINFHGRYEYVPVESMYKAMETIVNIIMLTANYKK